ncbi:unnamed protein product [marine sediment metagenome]|uniref:Uncharacterized protein n=1 Tax=marine sediment metagenome TaxID=412755 RepID=X1U2X0_9ZZZZ
MRFVGRIVEENKAVTTIAVTSIIALFGIYALQYVMQFIAPREEIEYPEPYGAMWFLPAGHIMNVGYGAEGEPEYFGEAFPGTLDSEAKWRIYRYGYEMIEGDLQVARVRFASGNTNFDKVWDDREEYEYS